MTLFSSFLVALLLTLLSFFIHPGATFVVVRTFPVPSRSSSSSSSSTRGRVVASGGGVFALQASSTSKLPPGLSPFEKSVAKGLDVQSNFRSIAAKAIERALKDGNNKLLEIDFPPFLGGDKSKTQFDDYDNIQELNANRDWCTQLAPMLMSAGAGTGRRIIWLIFPDDKECELAKKEWGGQRYRNAAKFTSIRAACTSVVGTERTQKAWGSTLAEQMNKLAGGDGILADSSTLDALDKELSSPRLHLVCQPGNGGPVEDWINVERLHKADPSQVTCVVNGALDKVRDGYYPALFFPALAASIPFYKQFESVFFLKPVSDKGVYGWIYRVYPEPWQVILQRAQGVMRGGKQVMTVEETTVLLSNTRPTYAQAVQALVAANAKASANAASR